MKKQLNVKDYEFITSTDRFIPGNVTTIIIKKSLFNVLESGVNILKYHEVEDNNYEKCMKIPYAIISLKNGEYDHIIKLCGIHINGVASQFPQNGIKSLINYCNRQKEEQDTLLIGDFNTVPENIKNEYKYFGNNRIVDSLAPVNYYLLVPNYFTHVNPYGNATKYDYAIYIQSKLQKGDIEFEILPIENLPVHSSALVHSITNSTITKQQFYSGYTC